MSVDPRDRQRPDPGRRVTSVLIVLASFGVGGAERVVVQLANTLARRLPTTLVVVDGRGPLRAHVQPAVELVDLQARRVRHAAGPLRRLIRTRRPSVVLSSQTHVNLLTTALAPLHPTGVRTVVREADLRRGRSRSDRSVRLAHRTLYRSLDLVLATSPWMAHDLATRHRGPIAVLPNPVDVPRLRAAAAAPSADANGSGRTFVHVGRLIAAKGAADVIEAFAKGATADDRLVIVGDGPEHDVLKARVATLGLTDRVRLVGLDPEPSRLVARADVLVTGSYTEGMPNVVLEALAVGTPALATDDLVTLASIAATFPAGALRQVPRAGLAAAIAATPRAVTRTAEDGLRPSLLPDHHLPERVVDRLLGLLDGAGQGD